MEGNLVYLFAAAAVIWVAIFAYLLSISGRLSALRRELEVLEEERSAQTGDRATPSWGDEQADDRH